MMFGLFGVLAYLLPVIVFSLYLYYILMVEKDDGITTKILAILGLVLIICIFTELIGADMASQTGYDPAAIYTRSAENRSGGGILGGTIAFVLYQLLKGFGTILVLLVGAAACAYALVQKSILEMARDTAMDARLHHLERLEEQERYQEEHPEEFEEDYEDSEGDYENPQGTSHYEESRQRYQQLQRERRTRLRQVQEQQKAARYREENLDADSMWNTDLSADAAFLGASAPVNAPSENPVEPSAEAPAENSTVATAKASAEAGFETVDSESFKADMPPAPADPVTAPAKTDVPEEQAPPVIIDPQASILEYKKAQEEQKRQEELQRLQEAEEVKRQERKARELRRNQESLHELYPEDYLDEEENELPESSDKEERTLWQEETPMDGAGVAGIVTAAVSSAHPSMQSHAATQAGLHAGGMLAENILMDPSEMAYSDIGSPVSSAKASDDIPDVFEEVPGIRVIKKESADAGAGIPAASAPETDEPVMTAVPKVTAQLPDAVFTSDAQPKDHAKSIDVPERSLMDSVPSAETPREDRLPNIPVHTEREVISAAPDTTPEMPDDFKDVAASREDTGRAESMSQQPAMPQEEKKAAPVRREYVFPPISLLHRGESSTADSDDELRETAQLLQTTLRNFGVKITITDISQGPSVTRYEMLPEMGVKVSKIVSLADDIKLALAATDIRIEAPIPGKSAIGIEVPNKEAAPVALRDIVDTEEFRGQKSKLAFAVGKDIGGKPVFGDIAKMPHVLIAGATGSGKSVCINTIIMSLLFHAKPEEVKLIMIDPKVVELSVYNGIPHLMIPVVTNPQKAAAALNWGVAEMEARYRAFADARVRDIKGYNALVRQHQQMQGGTGNEAVMHFMPQLVIIVDELADLMMVAKNDVETAICRLAQLARAAGIHLIIATQRPSVDVITGLIKANMPSRIAFRVSSGVDSRTILDMNGAEKLLGKGDMLFFPQGLPKPNRVQGCFVSDDEVTDVVNFLVANNPVSEEESKRHQQEIDAIEAGTSTPAAAGTGTESAQESDVDELFASAGRFIIERGNASIGLLQRKYRIGFNRAARIMDQLCEKGVVGEAVGTKARAILMTLEQFDSYCRDNGYESID